MCSSNVNKVSRNFSPIFLTSKIVIKLNITYASLPDHLSGDGIMMHMLEHRDQPKFHFRWSRVSFNHGTDFFTHIDGKILGPSGKSGGGINGRPDFNGVLGVQGLANIMVNLFPLRDDWGHSA